MASWIMPADPLRPRVLGHLWSHFTWRHWCHTPWRTVILIGILALGVAVFFSIRLANRAAIAGFQLFSENVTGTSDLVITSPAGKLPVTVLPQIREALGDLPAGLFPVLESTAVLPSHTVAGHGQQTFEMLGVDLAALSNIVYLSGGSEVPLNVRMSPVTAASGPPIYVTRAAAEAHGWRENEDVQLTIDDAIHTLHVAGFLPSSEFSIQAPDRLIVIDLPALQQLTGQTEEIHRVELRIPSGHWESEWRRVARERLEKGSEERWLVETPDQRRESGRMMTQAFRLNLSILSCLALLVGIYLILQALEAAVVRRRPEIATLRALGVSPFAIRRAWQFEALILGLLGTVIGLLLGWALAQLTVRAIAQTVNTLYYSNTTEAAAWHWGEAALASALGILASGVAGWLPARDASLTPPAQMLQRGTRADGLKVLLKPWVGIVFVLLALAAHGAPAWRTAQGGVLPLGGYVAAFFWVAGAGILAGLWFPCIARLGGRLGQRVPELFYAASQLLQATGRHRLATAGLVVAVAMAGGMSILVGSFEQTVQRWLDQVMKADLFIAPQGSGNASSRNRLSEQTWRALIADAAVANAEVSQFHRIRYEGVPVILAGVGFEGALAPESGPIWLEEPESMDPPPGVDEIWGVMSEPFAYRFHHAVGDMIDVPTPTGVLAVRLVGIYADYGNEFGTIAIERETLARAFEDSRAARMAIHLRSGESLTETQERWARSFPGMVISNNRQLREEAVRIFHQTFAVTHGLKWIGILVAIAGLGLALASMLLERSRELATLRALGMTPARTARATAWESLGIALAGLVTGFLLSVVLGHLIVYVINRQAFGWTLLFTLPWQEFLILALGVCAVSGLVGYGIGRRQAASLRTGG